MNDMIVDRDLETFGRRYGLLMSLETVGNQHQLFKIHLNLQPIHSADLMAARRAATGSAAASAESGMLL